MSDDVAMVHELRHGDGIVGMLRRPPQSIDHVITDPPFLDLVEKKARRRAKRGGKGVEKREFKFRPLTADERWEACQAFAHVARRWVIVFSDVEGSHLWREDGKRAGLVYIRTGIWVREASTPQLSGDRPGQAHEDVLIFHAPGQNCAWNSRGKLALWSHPIERDRKKRINATQKPESLLVEITRDFTNRGELICDPYAGSGTHLVAAKLLGRQCIGWEERRSQHATAKRRLDLTREQLELPVDRSQRVKHRQIGLDLAPSSAPAAAA